MTTYYSLATPPLRRYTPKSTGAGTGENGAPVDVLVNGQSRPHRPESTSALMSRYPH